jgi:hypothetical protein
MIARAIPTVAADRRRARRRGGGERRKTHHVEQLEGARDVRRPETAGRHADQDET